MRKNNIFDGCRPFWKADERRRNSPIVEFGREWSSRTLPASVLALYWVEETGEFYIQDLVSYLIYLTDRRAPDLPTAKNFLMGWRARMKAGKIEDYFSELRQIASKDAQEPSQQPITPVVVPKPDPYAKWRGGQSNAKNGGITENKADDDDLPF